MASCDTNMSCNFSCSSVTMISKSFLLPSVASKTFSSFECFPLIDLKAMCWSFNDLKGKHWLVRWLPVDWHEVRSVIFVQRHAWSWSKFIFLFWCTNILEHRILLKDDSMFQDWNPAPFSANKPMGHQHQNRTYDKYLWKVAYKIMIQLPKVR